MDKAEFDLIKSYFAPLTNGYKEAYGLTNDAALISLDNDRSSVVTMDTLVEGVHFFSSDPAGDIARKCLRVNLSDLAAMGAMPVGYTLSMAYRDDITSNWVQDFTAALAEDQYTFNCHLIGGDTVSTPGPLTITIACFGSVPRAQCLKRSTAKEGYDIWVSGTIGDSTAGLKILKGELTCSDKDHSEFLIKSYRVPNPRVKLGVTLLQDEISITALDVSDGLMADAGHIAKESGLQGRIFADAVPLSPAFKALYQSTPEEGLKTAVTGGDDYELLFTAPPSERATIENLSLQLALPITRIGITQAGMGILLIGKDGNSINLSHQGWKHF